MHCFGALGKSLPCVKMSENGYKLLCTRLLVTRAVAADL